ncbi:MAG: hypothetical protein ACTSU0_06875, partial [Alphaproteobacteria bacterium]
LLRRQTGVGGKRKLGFPLSLVLIPEDLEMGTKKLLSTQIQMGPRVTADANPFRNDVDWLVEPQLAEVSTVGWYAFTNPGWGRGIVHVHQTGYETMVTRTYYTPETNCRTYQCEGRFAAALNNHRGVVRNAGTGA